MAVAHETFAESHTGTTPSASEAFFDTNVAFTVNSKGLIVATFVLGATGDLASSVKIAPAGANSDVPAVTGGRAVDTAGEAGDCKTWFTDTGIPTTTTAVRVNRSNTSDQMYAILCTVTATGVPSVHLAGIVLLQGDGAVAQQNVDDGSPGTDSQRYAFGYYGGADIATTLTVGANSTDLGGIDVGARVARGVRETTPGQGSRPVGMVAVSDDRAFVHLAIKETIATATSVVRPRSRNLAGIIVR